MSISARIAVSASILAGAFGLADLIGVTAAVERANGDPKQLALIVPILIVLGGFVAAGELAKSRLLQDAHAAEGAREWLARIGWGTFVAISIALSHQALTLAERTLLAPTIAPLDAAVTKADEHVQAALRAERATATDYAQRIANATHDADTAPKMSEREKARASRDAMYAEKTAAETRQRDATARARAELTDAQAKRQRAPRGFLSLSIPLPLGLPALAFMAWLLPAVMEFLSSALNWIATPPPPRGPRTILFVDILTLETDGLELLDLETLEALGPKLASLKAKRDALTRIRRMQKIPA